jgi:hypothetical protein
MEGELKNCTAAHTFGLKSDQPTCSGELLQRDETNGILNALTGLRALT